MKPDEDPGWDFGILIPIVGRRRARKRAASGVAQMRYVFTAFCGAIVMFAFVLSLMGGGDEESGFADPGSSGAWIGVGVAAGLLAIAIVSRIARRSLDGSNLEALAKDYRSRFFACIAVGESVALAAFAGVFLTGDRAVYFAVAPLTLMAFALVAPTRGHLERDHDDLRRRGSLLSIYEALGPTTAS